MKVCLNLFDQIVTVLKSSQLWKDGPNTFTPKHQQTATNQCCLNPEEQKTYYTGVEA
jgi:hypothetical protein